MSGHWRFPPQSAGSLTARVCAGACGPGLPKGLAPPYALGVGSGAYLRGPLGLASQWVAACSGRVSAGSQPRASSTRHRVKKSPLCTRGLVWRQTGDPPHAVRLGAGPPSTPRSKATTGC